MKGWRRTILIWIVIVEAVMGVSVGCGQERREEKYETQIDMEEAGEIRYDVSGGRNGKSGEAAEHSEANGIGKPQIDSQSEESCELQKESTFDEAAKTDSAAAANEYWAAETSSVTYTDDQPEESKSQGEPAGSEPETESETESESKSESESDSKPESEKQETAKLQPYYLTLADKDEVIAQLIRMGESYGLTYYPDVTESETWDSPTPIYEEELKLGRDYVISTMVEYTEGAFVLMQMEGCSGFALEIKEAPETVTDAYYEVYVYWM